MQSAETVLGVLREPSRSKSLESPVRGNSYAGLYVPRTVMLRMGLEGRVFPAERVSGR
jgi:hypothetical protein